ncbi:hypothetical protein CFREI_07215 [Corynebacterium freiburgense]|nr:hypothetical protein CFREI_07215 [Corynebacterium freiburgense]
MIDILPLIGLALVDSLSIGTLIIPIALIVLWGKVHISPISIYLGTVLICYFALGLALLFGLQTFNTLGDQSWFHWTVLIIGIGLTAIGFLSPTPKRNSATASEKVRKTNSKSMAAMISLALGASVVEAFTMLPYLAAMGIIQSFEISSTSKIGIILLYCIIMILPATLISAIALSSTSKKFLSAIESWIPRLEYEAKITLLWVAAIAGIYIVFTRATVLGLISN